ncbi:chaperonin GroEL [Arboricoccus pini]|uniref:60 kDa chaperonin n=1 Tax=Arboricoccus pini TaxID=1963835 RepID=A0A212RIR2_9PROT|nr:chaperonin GroEL [Arboricoccus pini]SNB72331.1 chaperonin GroEL [Arboricoccus pini]
MSSSTLHFGSDAHRALARGYRRAATLVAGTMGPFGRAVLVERPHHAPRLIRDGYRLMQELEIEPGPPQMAVQTLRELAWRTVDAVGDGSSSAIVATAAMLDVALPAITAGHVGSALQAELDRLAPILMAGIARRTRPLADRDELTRVAVMAAGDDADIGHLVARALTAVGPGGHVQVDTSPAREDSLDHEAGLCFDQGWLSSGFAQDEPEGAILLDDPLIVLHRHPITDLAPLIRVLEMVAEANRSLLIIAENVTGQALTTLLLNQRQVGLKVAAVKAPGHGVWRDVMLEDLAIATGGTVIAPERGTTLGELRPAMLGRADRARVTRQGTSIVGGRGAPQSLAERRAAIGRQIKAEQHLDFDREQHRKRLARLSGGIATLRIAGRIAVEAEERCQRAKRALAAARAAEQDGVTTIGAALAVLAELKANPEGGLPAALALRMLEAGVSAPIQAVAANRGLDGAAVARRLLASPESAYDVITDAVINARSTTLPESAAVLRTAIGGAISAASALMRVDLTISQAERVSEMTM